MSRKVIIDCDPGIDDAVALTAALFDPRLDVLAVTAVGGNVPVEQAARNVQVIIERLDPPKYPRLGIGASPSDGPLIDGRQLHGDDGLANSGYAVSRLQHQHMAEKLIADQIRSSPDEVTILCLGPLTNIASTFRREPDLARMIDRIIISGGCVDGIGNVTAAAEFNMCFDAPAARDILRSPTTKTMIPLDVSRRVKFGFDLVDKLPTAHSRAGKLLRDLLPFYFRAYHQKLGRENIHLQDAVAVVAAVQPELFATKELSGDVETRGDLTMGATVFDRRPNAVSHSDLEVALDLDVDEVVGQILRGMMFAGQSSI